jgi:hypothetical protein
MSDLVQLVSLVSWLKLSAEWPASSRTLTIFAILGRFDILIT